MYIKQLSVFVENKSGKMADVLSILGENNIDISALSIADTTDFGILRLIVCDPERAAEILRANDIVVKVTNVLAIGIEDKSGSLAVALNALKNNEIEIEYMYAFIGKSEYGALVIIKADKPEEAISVLQASNVKLVEAKQIYRV